jgi:hypothetical protein
MVFASNGAKQILKVGPEPLDTMPWYSSLFAWFSSIFFTKSAEIAIIGLQASHRDLRDIRVSSAYFVAHRALAKPPS